MTGTSATADRWEAPDFALAMGEGRASLEWAVAGSLPHWQLWQDAPRGHGDPVLVLPGLLTDDRWTAPMRRLLKRLGHAPHGWQQGTNRGPAPAVMARLEQRLIELSDRHGQPVALVGWSLGGALGYALAGRHPERVRQLITLSSPLSGHAEATRAETAYALATSGRDPHADLVMLMAQPPRCPITSVSSREDGVIAWPATQVRHHGLHENLLVKSTHWALPVNAQTLWVVGHRLAQHAWRAYEPERDDSPWLPPTERVGDFKSW